jgi:hypothetical protein
MAMTARNSVEEKQIPRLFNNVVSTNFILQGLLDISSAVQEIHHVYSRPPLDRAQRRPRLHTVLIV